MHATNTTVNVTARSTRTPYTPGVPFPPSLITFVGIALEGADEEAPENVEHAIRRRSKSHHLARAGHLAGRGKRRPVAGDRIEAPEVVIIACSREREREKAIHGDAREIFAGAVRFTNTSCTSWNRSNATFCLQPALRYQHIDMRSGL